VNGKIKDESKLKIIGRRGNIPSRSVELDQTANEDNVEDIASLYRLRASPRNANPSSNFVLIDESNFSELLHGAVQAPDRDINARDGLTRLDLSS
jgi:hypothetical protein